MEDGEVIPPRFQKEVARVRIPGEERTLQREEARPGFGTPNLSQPPPTFTMRNYPVLGQPQMPKVFRPRGVQNMGFRH